MADYSCYITIHNNTPYNLTLTGKGSSMGSWQVDPPGTVAPFQASAEAYLKFGSGGSAGWVTYAANTPSSNVFKMNFACPASDPNYCDISNPNRARFSVSFFAKAGGGYHSNVCPKAGDELTVFFYVTSFV